MAVLEHMESGARCTLFARHLVGRSRSADLRLNEPNVSGEHALLRWTGTGWEIRDLGSRNGTFIDEHRLELHARMRVHAASVIGFGHTGNRWRLIDDAPPGAVAMERDDPAHAPVHATGGLLALPGPDEPEAVVYRNRSNEWVVERDGLVQPIADGAELAVAGRHYVLRLPDLLRSTVELSDHPSLEQLRLRFAVASDEEYVHVTAASGRSTIDLGARAHHYLLLTLARARRRDHDAGVPAREAGWVYHDELARQLAMDERHVNIAVFRCRQQLGAAGIADAVGIIQRRAPTRQLRLGLDASDVEIVST